MSTVAGNVVTVNTGSSSIKIVIFAKGSTKSKTPILALSVTDIGQPTAILQITFANEPTQTEKIHALDHIAASHVLIERLARIISPDSVAAIGHRLVHGGVTYTEPMPVAIITEADWELLSQLDPEHTPAARQLIDQFAKQYPSTMQVACFDTAFFRDLPHVAQIVPIPQKYFAEGVRRYGFHGLSYTSLLETFRERAGETAANGRIIMAHLGSGASLTATRLGKPVDTTMGFTPTSGIAMSTRSGDLDPSIFGFLHRQNNMTADEFDHMINFESGLLGVSGVSDDMHSLLNLEKNNKDAAMAIELFVHDVKKSIGALAAVLGGVDSLIFSGGIGEQSAIIRARICQDLAYMGVEISEDANTHHAFLISSESSKVGVHVIQTDEALVIATKTQELVNKTDNK